MIGLEHFPERVPVKSNHALRHAREGGHPVLRFGAVMADAPEVGVYWIARFRGQ
ncbi:MAG TPA: hypothetical protein VJ454_02130 [Steroidobacteraceae bacterium]|nr:hypothetical protein [Steroidobacteraceae bacterium]